MLSDTLTTELERYRIGPRIRALRKEKKLGLVQLGEHTGLSPAMLSKIERGQLFPTLPTLVRIALVFGVDLGHFFSREGPRIAVTREGERVRLPIPPGEAQPFYFLESLDYPLPERRMEAFLADFPDGAMASTPHQHGQQEFVFVLTGTLCIDVDGKGTTLGAGDAIAFDSGAPHSYRREGAEGCRAIVVTLT